DRSNSDDAHGVPEARCGRVRQIALPPGRQLVRHVRRRHQKMSAIQAAGALTQSQPAGTPALQSNARMAVPPAGAIHKSTLVIHRAAGPPISAAAAPALSRMTSATLPVRALVVD